MKHEKGYLNVSTTRVLFYLGKLHIKGCQDFVGVGEVHQETVVLGGGLLSVLFCMEGGDKQCRFDAVGLRCPFMNGQEQVDVL